MGRRARLVLRFRSAAFLLTNGPGVLRLTPLVCFDLRRRAADIRAPDEGSAFARIQGVVFGPADT